VNTKKQIKVCLAAKVGLVWIQTEEEYRAEQMLLEVASEMNPEFGVKFWTATLGLQDATGQTVREFPYPPFEALKEASEEGGGRVLTVFRDLGAQLPDSLLERAIRDSMREIAARKGAATSKAIVVIDTRKPPENIPGITIIDMDLPTRDDIERGILDPIAQNNGIKDYDSDEIVSAAVGMTSSDITNAITKSIAATSSNGSKRIDPEMISSDKKQIIAKKGVLEWYEPDPRGFGAVGGLDVFKEWLVQRRSGFSQEAREYGLPSPRGVLAVGVPGCGKSLSAKCTAAAWKIPLIRMDVGNLFGGIVGESEGKVREAIKSAEAVAPCVLWIDELEKGFAGSVSGAASDAGTSSRVFATMLTWLQEKTAPVFVMATANDTEQLPPEFLRAGRWDEIFFVDLPNGEERFAIAEIFKKKFAPTAGVEIAPIVGASEGYTGAEMEACWVSSLYTGFQDGKRPVKATDIVRELGKMVPQSESQKSKIDKIREFVKTSKARNASRGAEAEEMSREFVREVESVA
jgi:SpoVK/Ycf46/Vps4 family AAA+-type ATPase